MKNIFYIIFLLSPYILTGQQSNSILEYDEFIANILQYHPIAKQANLKIENADAEMLAAKGLLDPKIYSSWDQKNFDKKQYYLQYDASITVPTKLGIDLIGGYENTSGINLNPENTTDIYGLWHLGIEANLIQGLIINNRKIAQEKAVAFQTMASNERQIILNQLIFEASLTYLEWQQYQSNETIINENLKLSKQYLKNTVQTFQLGEKTAMDTLEAFIIYQDAINLFKKNKSLLIKARQNIEYFLWINDNPITLRNNVRPEDMKKTEDEITNPNTTIPNNNPIIIAAINKKSIQELDQKLKREKLKPKLKVKYNPLIATTDNSPIPNLSARDFKWGFSFSYPILRRSEKADIRKGEIKINEINFDIANKRNALNTKIKNSVLQQQIIAEQIDITESNIIMSKQLLDGEKEKFNYGESSVFLLNKRQEKYISTQLKLISLQVKFQAEIFNYLLLNNQIIN